MADWNKIEMADETFDDQDLSEETFVHCSLRAAVLSGHGSAKYGYTIAGSRSATSPMLA
jgi:hypothetical protein